ncbi:hypothetical protein AB0395_35780 [Streptosporangium sp. NPDC051023]|uniref:hypothetical protein n=1 Tax=Streptosporangium sp. NPDC051023 TaxID=3155410 RepID=UPI00344BFD9C
MTRLLNKVGDALLTLTVPQAEAAADPTYLQCYCNACNLWRRICGPGGCSDWDLIGQCTAGGCNHGPWTC